MLINVIKIQLECKKKNELTKCLQTKTCNITNICNNKQMK